MEISFLVGIEDEENNNYITKKIKKKIKNSIFSAKKIGRTYVPITISFKPNSAIFL